jgi:hypothetical protein
MTVLREIVARLGFEVDKTGFQAAERGIAQVQTQLAATSKRLGVVGAAATSAGGRMRDTGGKFVATGKAAAGARAGMAVATSGASAFGGALGKLVAAAGIGQVLRTVVQLASDANETGNVLEQVFGAQGGAQVKSWSETASSALGRSRFQLQEFAGGLGAILDPMVQNRAKAQAMSTTLSTLAVDLGSFFNATDEDALAALRSGISGESEPLKRFGIVMQDATLQEYAHTQGINKKLTAMNVAEKTELRYQFILARTKSAQGDAARTAGGFANSSKALKGSLRDLGTEMGVAVMPTLERMVAGASKAVALFKEWTKGTSVLQSAMVVLGAAAVALGASMLAPFVVPAAAAIALIFIIDELWNMFRGGKSVIGDYIEAVGGLGTVDEIVRNHAAGVDILAESWRNLWTDADPSRLQDQIGWFGELELVGERLYNLYARLGTAIADFFSQLPGIGGAAHGQQRVLSSSERTVGRGVGAGLMTPKQAREQGLKEKAADITAERNATKAGRALGRGYGAPVEEIQSGRATPSAIGASPMVSAPTPAPSATTPPVVVQSGNTNVTVNVSGGNPAEVRRAVLDALAAERRKSNAALARPGSG